MPETTNINITEFTTATQEKEKKIWGVDEFKSAINNLQPGTGADDYCFLNADDMKAAQAWLLKEQLANPDKTFDTFSYDPNTCILQVFAKRKTRINTNR